MRSIKAGPICMLLIVCILCAGLHIDLKHWIQYDENSCGALGDAYITSPDEYSEVEIAIRQSEQLESSEVFLRLGRITRKCFFADWNVLLPERANIRTQFTEVVYEYERDEIEIINPCSVMVDYVHRQDGRKRI